MSDFYSTSIFSVVTAQHGVCFNSENKKESWPQAGQLVAGTDKRAVKKWSSKGKAALFHFVRRRMTSVELAKTVESKQNTASYVSALGTK